MDRRADDSKYEPVEYDEFDDYSDRAITTVGLPASQLALIIGVNAVISLVISISVVLLAGRQGGPSDATGAALKTGSPAASITGTLSSQVGKTPDAATTPIQTVTYAVQSGDTLSAIAKKFAVSLSDLMVANGLTNQDFIQVGQELIIPVGGMGTPTPTFTPAPAPTDTPLPFEPPTPLPTGAVVPVEPAVTVGPSPTPTATSQPTPTPIPTSTSAPFGEIQVVVSEVIGPGDLLQETLVILNKGAGARLTDWKLKGSPLGIFVFPDIFLFSGGSIRIHTAAGENTASDLYLNQGEAAWPAGSTIILSDSKDIEISRFTVPSAATATP
jgi:LysM repeat protein